MNFRVRKTCRVELAVGEVRRENVGVTYECRPLGQQAY